MIVYLEVLYDTMSVISNRYCSTHTYNILRSKYHARSTYYTSNHSVRLVQQAGLYSYISCSFTRTWNIFIYGVQLLYYSVLRLFVRSTNYCCTYVRVSRILNTVLHVERWFCCAFSFSSVPVVPFYLEVFHVLNCTGIYTGIIHTRYHVLRTS